MTETIIQKTIEITEYTTKDGMIFNNKKEAESWERVIGLKKVFVLIHLQKSQTVILFDSYDKVIEFYEKEPEENYLLQELFINECENISVREYLYNVRIR